VIEPLFLSPASTGKVGPHVAREVVDAGVRVRSLALPGDDREHLLPPEVERVRGSLADDEAVAAALDGVSGVYWMWPFFHLGVAAAPRMVELMKAQAAHVVLVPSSGYTSCSSPSATTATPTSSSS
jgi:uncharacterized protein YbjT (DUF2867 family)